MSSDGQLVNDFHSKTFKSRSHDRHRVDNMSDMYQCKNGQQSLKGSIDMQEQIMEHEAQSAGPPSFGLGDRDVPMKAMFYGAKVDFLETQLTVADKEVIVPPIDLSCIVSHTGTLPCLSACCSWLPPALWRVLMFVSHVSLHSWLHTCLISGSSRFRQIADIWTASTLCNGKIHARSANSVSKIANLRLVSHLLSAKSTQALSFAQARHSMLRICKDLQQRL